MCYYAVKIERIQKRAEPLAANMQHPSCNTRIVFHWRTDGDGTVIDCDNIHVLSTLLRKKTTKKTLSLFFLVIVTYNHITVIIIIIHINNYHLYHNHPYHIYPYYCNYDIKNDNKRDDDRNNDVINDDSCYYVLPSNYNYY